MKNLLRLPSLFLFSIVLAISACGGGGVAGANGGTPPPTYSISGTISGLNAGSSITLQDNGGDNLTQSTNGSFTFATNQQSGAAYNVSILTPPANQPCSSTYTAGTVNAANVTNVNIFCGPPAVGAFSAGGSMLTPRTFFTLTVLPNGKVLATGGQNAGVGPQALYPYTVLSSAELYDPATNTWSATGSMANVRSGHTATLLANGKVLVMGGNYPNAYNNYSPSPSNAELYDPASGAWSATGAMVYNHGTTPLTLLPNGEVLVAGGCATACAELFDPATSTWSAAGTMSAARYMNMAALLPNGKVLVAGGSDPVTFALLASAELYDPVANTWAPAANMLTARNGLFSALLPNGKVMVSDKATTEIYDPVGNLWAAAGNAPTTISVAQIGAYMPFTTLLPTGKVFVQTDLFDPATNIWAATASMPSPVRNAPAGALLPNGKVLIAGGWTTGSISINTTLLYW